MKRFAFVLLSLLLLQGSFPCAAVDVDNDVDASEWQIPEEPVVPDITVYVNGSSVEFDVKPQIIDGRTMVPVRAIFEVLGAVVEWDEATRTVVSSKADTTVRITIGEYKINKNGLDIAVDVPAQIVDSRTLVPVRAIAESYNCKVEWDEATRSVNVVTFTLEPAVATTADTTYLFSINNFMVSDAFYDVVSNWAVLASNGNPLDEQTLINQMKLFAAIEQLTHELDITLAPHEKYAFDYMIYQSKQSGEYAFLMSQLDTTDFALREILRLDLMYTKLQQAIISTLDFSDEARLAFMQENYVRVKHILVHTEQEALAAVERINGGESFESLCAELSLDGMDVGTGYVFTYGQMITAFEEASFALEIGEISAPIQTAYGYHIIKKYDMFELGEDLLLANFADQIDDSICAVAINAVLNYAFSNMQIEVYKEDLFNTIH